MNYIQSTPHFLFLIVIVGLLAFGFYRGNEMLDINIHATYYLISWKHLMILISVIYGILALIYFGLLKLNFGLVNWMTVSHVLISIIGLFAVFVLPKFLRESVPGDMVALLKDMNFNQRIEIGIVISIFALFGAQLLFFINVIYALIKGRF